MKTAVLPNLTSPGLAGHRNLRRRAARTTCNYSERFYHKAGRLLQGGGVVLDRNTTLILRAGGAMHPDYPHFDALAAWLQDDQLCEAIGVADEQPTLFRLHDNGQREAFVAAMSAEVVQRLDGQRAA